MPMYLATFSAEIIHETSGQFMNVDDEEYEFYAEDEEDAKAVAEEYLRKEIFDVIMSNISIVPEFENLEALEEEDDADV